MLCEKCNKKKIAVLYRENLNGHIRSLQVCNDCANLLASIEELETVGFEVAGMLSPLGQSEGLYLPLSVYVSPAEHRTCSPAPAPKCHGCGLSWDEIVRDGKIGCAHCYSVYGNELTPVVHSTHGTTGHTGRCSADHRARVQKAEKLADLKKRLKEAVSTEKFEIAAELRDQIRSLEAEL